MTVIPVICQAEGTWLHSFSQIAYLSAQVGYSRVDSAKHAAIIAGKRLQLEVSWVH